MYMYAATELHQKPNRNIGLLTHRKAIEEKYEAGIFNNLHSR